ncbi:MAG: PepSY-associated TM helix domain-containing protein [Cyclobacteriaceae bacterium]
MKISLTKKQYFKLHGWLGMNFGLLLTLICLSGVIATLSHEIEWLAKPSLRINPQGPVRWQDTYEALQKAYPEFYIGGFAKGEVSVMDELAWMLSPTAPGGNWGNVRVDPYRAEVVQGVSRLYLADFFRQLHYNFFHSWGYYLVCFISFPLLLSVISGLLFYKKWWKSLFKLRIGKGRHAFYSSLHRFIGVWTMIFGLIIGITGVWYFMEITVMPDDTIYTPPPEIPEKKMASHGTSPQLLPLETYLEAAIVAFPDLDPNGIYLPYSPGYPVTVQGQAGGVLVRDRANAVYLDPFDAEVIGIKRSKEHGAVSWWVNSVDALHFGYWGGLTTKILWAIFGLCLPALILCGAYLSLRRAGVIDNEKKHLSKQKIPHWQRYPLRTWVILPLLFILVGWGIQGYDKRNIKVEAPPQSVLSETQVGPWPVSISREEVIYSGTNTLFFTKFQVGKQEIANFKEAYLLLIDHSENVIQKAELYGPPHSMWTDIELPEEIEEISLLEIHVTGWDNQSFSRKIPVDFTEASKIKLAKGETKAEHKKKTAQPPTGNLFFGLVFGYVVLDRKAKAW